MEPNDLNLTTQRNKRQASFLPRHQDPSPFTYHQHTTSISASPHQGRQWRHWWRRCPPPKNFGDHASPSSFFSNARKTGAALIPFMASRTRLPETVVSGFSHLKVVAGSAVIDEGIATPLAREDSAARHHATIPPPFSRPGSRMPCGHTPPSTSFDSPAARPPRGFLSSWFSVSTRARLMMRNVKACVLFGIGIGVSVQWTETAGWNDDEYAWLWLFVVWVLLRGGGDNCWWPCGMG